MKTIKTTGLLIIILILTFASCKKSTTQELIVPEKMTIQESGFAPNIRLFSYKDHQLVKIQDSASYSNFEYRNDTLFREDVYNLQNNVKDIYYIYRYGKGGKILRIEYWIANIKSNEIKYIIPKSIQNLNLSQPYKIDLSSVKTSKKWDIFFFYEEFHYDAYDVLLEVNYFRITEDGTFAKQRTSVSTNFDSKNNLREVKFSDDDSEYFEKIVYTYDDFENPYQNISIPLILTSTNNNIIDELHYIMNERVDTYSSSYVYNNNKFPTLINIEHREKSNTIYKIEYKIVEK